MIRHLSSSIRCRGTALRLFFEWLVLLLILILVVVWLASSSAIQMANLYVYDRLLPMHERVADSRVVLVNIDDKSINALGRWPWPRVRHEQLFNKLAEQSPRAVLFDVLLTEPTADDAKVGAAMAGLPRLSAPVLLINSPDGGWDATLPVASVAQVAKLGHIALTPDFDGVVRRVPLSRVDNQGVQWTLLTQTLLSDDVPSRNDDLMVPFNVRQGSYVSFSYDDVLAGRVPTGFLTDKYILIGANAVGLGDQYPTPSSSQFGVMPGIEIHANILDALLNHVSVESTDSVSFAILPLVLLMLTLLFTHERYHLLCFVSVLVVYVVIICTLLWWRYFWLPPVLGVIGLGAAYVLWSWRRLAVVMRYVSADLRDLRAQTGQVFRLLPRMRGSNTFQLHALEQDIEHARHLSLFIASSLQRLPTAMCLLDSHGVVLMFNQRAFVVFGECLAVPQQSKFLDVLAEFDASSAAWMPQIKNDWSVMQGQIVSDPSVGVFELHVVKIDLDSSYSKMQGETVWQVSLVDLSKEREAQRQRNELMAFLSHDLRAPQVGILALMELYQSPKVTMTPNELAQAVSGKVHDTLSWANNLVELSRTQSREFYHMTELSLIELLYTATQQVWPQAHEKNIELRIDEQMNESFEQAYVLADGGMIVRALVNLLINAIRYSPSGSYIDITLKVDGGYVTCCICDKGVGIAEAQLNRLNQGLNISSAAPAKPDAAGSLGVGLSMVMAVVRYHRGQLRFFSQLDLGTRVLLSLPLISTLGE